MNIAISKRVSSVKPSATLALTAKVAELKAQGRDIIGLGAGEPDFDTPEHIRNAAITAINQGFTRYTAVGGIPSLKDAICAKLQRDNQLIYKPENILVSCGAKQSIYNCAQALLNPGDEVVIIAPYWVSYPDIALLAGAKPVIIETGIEQNFKVSPEKLRASLTDKTKLIILNSPSNPTGVAYSKSELAALGDILKAYPNAFVLSDDIYEHILWSQEPFANILMACPDLYERTIVVNGVSKAYAMTGWRIGYAAAPAAIIKAMAKVQGQSTSNPCSISQKAAEAALIGDQGCVQTMLKAFKERHDWLIKELNSLPGIECLPIDGAFYILFKVSDLITSLSDVSNDTELADYLLEKAEIALVPGIAFGAPGYLRLSFATSTQELQMAISRLKKLLAAG